MSRIESRIAAAERRLPPPTPTKELKVVIIRSKRELSDAAFDRRIARERKRRGPDVELLAINIIRLDKWVTRRILKAAALREAAAGLADEERLAAEIEALERRRRELVGGRDD